jgi:hypothetical protein
MSYTCATKEANKTLVNDYKNIDFRARELYFNKNTFINNNHILSTLYT